MKQTVKVLETYFLKYFLANVLVLSKAICCTINKKILDAIPEMLDTHKCIIPSAQVDCPWLASIDWHYSCHGLPGFELQRNNFAESTVSLNPKPIWIIIFIFQLFELNA